MKLYSENKNYKLYQGNMLDMLDTIEKDSIDSIVTDPPYELNFMGKGWDNAGVSFDKETWKKCYDVLKPGGYLLAFGGSRTYHRIACAIEDAGFEIRDTIMWLYGCLSEDTEVLTESGFKPFHKITEYDKIRVYDIKNGIYKWEKPERWQTYRIDKNTCYHIKSDTTDQIVSQNHRVYVERDGKLVWEFAENCKSMERVPVLSYDIPYLQKGKRNILLSNMLWQSERLAKELLQQWKGQEEFEKGFANGEKPLLERWRNLQKKKGQLFRPKYKVCEVSERVYNDGEKRWLCNGTQVSGSESDSKTTIENGSSPSYKSQCGGQQDREFDVVCEQQRPQGLRKWKAYQTTLATIEPIEYSGIIFCPTVSTGCFVARRNGKVFLTGNSGFPKSMNIGKGIEAKEKLGNAGTRNKRKIEQSCDGEAYTIKQTNNGAMGEVIETTRKEYVPSTELSNKWSGWGTCLKPSFEPIIVARKPFKGSLVDNVMANGVGGMNIDECRVPFNGDKWNTQKSGKSSRAFQSEATTTANGICEANDAGRFPANTILTYNDEDFEEVCGGFPDTKSNGGKTTMPDLRDVGKKSKEIIGIDKLSFGQVSNAERKQSTYIAPYDSGSAARYFYCAKASKKDRDEGLEDLPDGLFRRMRPDKDDSNPTGLNKEGRFAPVIRKNTHPTVKPTELMQYLIRLVTPNGGTILDPFNGSGSTGKAVMYENKERNKNYKYIGIELTEEYLPIAKARIEYVCEETEKRESQLTIFDLK